MKMTVNTALTGTVTNLNKIASASIATNTTAGISNYKDGVNAQAMSTLLKSAYVGGQLTLIGDSQNRFVSINYTQTNGSSQCPAGIVDTAVGVTNDATGFTVDMNEPLYTKNSNGNYVAITTATNMMSSFAYSKASGSTAALATAGYTVSGSPATATLQFTTSGTPVKGDTVIFSQAGQMYDADGNQYMTQSFTYNGTKWVASGVSDQSTTLNSANGQVVSAVNPRLVYVDGSLKVAITENGEDKYYSFNYDDGAGVADYYTQMVSKLGVEAGAADNSVTNSQLMTKKIDDLRQGVSGVSLDEEMTDMIRYQRAYSACSRVITVVDEMLQVLIDKMGVI